MKLCSYWWSAFVVLLFFVIKKCIYLIRYVKPAIQTIQSFLQISFTYLSRSNAANTASSFIPFTSKKLLHHGKILVLLRLLCVFRAQSDFICLQELFGCAERLPISDQDRERVKWHWVVSIKWLTGGLYKHNQALRTIIQFSKWVSQSCNTDLRPWLKFLLLFVLHIFQVIRISKKWKQLTITPSNPVFCNIHLFWISYHFGVWFFFF